MPAIDSESLDQLLEYAHDEKATDIHITVGCRPTLRVHSHLKQITDAEILTPEKTKILVESCLDENRKKTLETNGEVDFSFSKTGLGRYRVNAFKQRGTYAMAIRSQPFIIPPFDALGLPSVIKTFAHKSKGLVLVTGATGSGKSTTLASLVNIVNEERECHIITVEDPIEYLHKHKKSLVNQREIGLDSFSFSTALRAALRQDPDVILVGEMRDLETISIALTAAETGHLVFSTLHTVGAAKTIDRIIDVFDPAQQNQIRSQLATVLEGVVSQQLMPKRDGTGLAVATEIMVVNPAIRNLIREGKPHQVNSILQTGASLGMQSMDGCLADLAFKGIISQEEALARAQDTNVLLQILNKRW